MTGSSVLFDLGTHEVANRQMCKLKVSHQLFALGAFAAARAT